MAKWVWSYGPASHDLILFGTASGKQEVIAMQNLCNRRRREFVYALGIKSKMCVQSRWAFGDGLERLGSADSTTSV